METVCMHILLYWDHCNCMGIKRVNWIPHFLNTANYLLILLSCQGEGTQFEKVYRDVRHFYTIFLHFPKGQGHSHMKVTYECLEHIASKGGLSASKHTKNGVSFSEMYQKLVFLPPKCPKLSTNLAKLKKNHYFAKKI